MKPNKIGLWTTTSIVVGNMIASGLFMLPATLAAYGGISLVGWIVSGCGAICLALVFAWLSKMMPDATGGPYAYTRTTMGDFAGFLVAWGYWISVWCTNAAIAVAFVSYLTAFIPALATNSLLSVSVGLGSIWFLTWINTKGIREAGFVQLLTTILKIMPLILITVGGLIVLNLNNFTPFNTSGLSDWTAITHTTTLTLFAFLGLECATIPSGSVANAAQTIPRATIMGTLITTALYFASTVAIMGIIPPAELISSTAPFADGAAVIMGEGARYVVAAGAVISTFGALNGWIIVQGQLPYAAARNNLFPKMFAKENKKGAPAFGIIISSALVSLLMSMNFSKSLADTYKFIILLSTLTVLVPYLFSIIAFAIMGARQKQLSPSRLVVATLAFLFSMWAVIGSGQEIVFWGFVLLMAGLPIYGFIRVKYFD